MDSLAECSRKKRRVESSTQDVKLDTKSVAQNSTLDLAHRMPKESDFGILAFRSPGSPISCTLKHRLSDFIVKEVDYDDQIAQVGPGMNTIPSIRKLSSDEVALRLREVLPSREADQMLVFLGYKSQMGGQEGETDELLIPTELNKDERRIVYESVKNSSYKKGCKISTVPYGETSSLLITRSSSESGDGESLEKNGRRGTKWAEETPWTKEKQYLKFCISKCNRDTHDAIGYLSRCIRRKPRDFTYAGMKDKRGVTSQW